MGTFLRLQSRNRHSDVISHCYTRSGTCHQRCVGVRSLRLTVGGRVFSPSAPHRLVREPERGAQEEIEPRQQDRISTPSSTCVSVTAERKLRILERLTSGLSVGHIAGVEQMTIQRVRQKREVN
jgi:DNA-binding NarL/FixJ family response regulator